MYVCKKASEKLYWLLRHIHGYACTNKNSGENLLRMVLPHLDYCAPVWETCGKGLRAVNVYKNSEIVLGV